MTPTQVLCTYSAESARTVTILLCAARVQFSETSSLWFESIFFHSEIRHDNFLNNRMVFMYKGALVVGFQ